ncbi:molybdopterin molybdotransferase MoeA [Arthrobacter sp. M4]|uniref:molybdopterin molybdotransferase MoeA n=1 Tax=Arthrobacter sp. M4 TaxID=218160 RepID=UPI001CDBBDC7|nr:molybdopterin molybdotransferase MoeA [Arthrobacter sp. M4]MCA4133833.1 molybdopterin molybdotransferase MoeA [Arthrobacter sp. M4]
MTDAAEPRAVETETVQDTYTAESDTAEPGPDSAQPRNLAHTWVEARELAFGCASPIPAGPVALSAAIGRVLAADVVAVRDVPHYASSAMDGWAVNGSGPWVVVEPGVLAGQGGVLAPHQASVIVTGGLVPAGAKAVLRAESGRMDVDGEGLPVLVLGEGARPGEPGNGQHIRPAGEEASAGEVLIRAGTVLNPAHVAIAAVAGLDELLVLGKPVVRLVLTGSEVVTSGVPEPGRVRDTFGPQLGAVVGMLGGIPAGQVRVGDSYDEWLAALQDTPTPEDTAGEGTAASRDEVSEGGPAWQAGPGGQLADVVITTGGTGRSGTDHFRAAIAALGGRLLIDGIAMRPGHPAVLAELPDGRFVVGLPGNPLAAMMALFTIAGPLLAALGHGNMPDVGEVPCGVTIDPDPGRTRLMPFRLVYGLASPAQHSAAGMMRGLASADGVMVVPPHGVQLGEPITAFPLPWGPPLPEPKTTEKPRKPPTKAQRRKSPSEPVDWSALDDE